MASFRPSVATSSRRTGILSSIAACITSRMAVSAAVTASTAGVLLLAWSNGCIDGATPNCAGDAGCGPGIDAALFDAVVSDGKANSDVHASDAAPDAIPDVMPDAAAASGGDGGDGAVMDAANLDSPATG